MSRVRAILPALCVVSLAACAGILGIRKRPDAPFPHRAHVLKGVACVRCHAATANAGVGGPPDLPKDSSCLQCHSPPHDPHPCGSCHGRAEDRYAATEAKRHLRFSHRDHTATTKGHCTRCHQAVLSVDGPLRPPMATCFSCHAHKQQWSARDCTPCHMNMQAEGTRPESHVVHGADFMKRHGLEAASSRDLCSSCHAESECASCHATNVPALPSTLHFDDPQRPDMHGAGFFARHSIEAQLDPGLCTTCHRDQQLCRDCHDRQGLLEISAQRGSPHPAGWVGPRGTDNRHGMEARLDPVRCASCHGGAGESLCVGCHRVGGPGGNPHPPGFSSSKPLRELPCRLCHMEGL